MASQSHFYHRLPIELQIKIFDETLEPRSLRIFDKDSCERSLERYKDGAPPVALQICQMLRANFLPQYPKLFQNEECTGLWQPHLRFNSHLDTIVMYSNVPQTLMDLSHRSSSHTSPSIRHLAISSSLWQAFVLTRQYPNWKKAMGNFTSLDSLSVVSDEMMPRLDEGVDRLKQAVEQTLLSVHRENKLWVIPDVSIIRTGEVCHKGNEQSSRLDLVDFARGDVKEDYLGRFTAPKCDCFVCDSFWAVRVFRNGFPDLRTILEWKRKDSMRTYVPTPSLFSLWPNDLAAQIPGGSRFILDDSTFVVPCTMAVLSFASFTVVSAL